VHLDRLSENAYFLNVGAYNILAIGFADHILVVENPLADSVSLEAIERMKKHFMRQASSAVSERFPAGRGLSAVTFARCVSSYQ
jgi:hypothetical protein